MLLSPYMYPAAFNRIAAEVAEVEAELCCVLEYRSGSRFLVNKKKKTLSKIKVEDLLVSAQHSPNSCGLQRFKRKKAYLSSLEV